VYASGALGYSAGNTGLQQLMHALFPAFYSLSHAGGKALRACAKLRPWLLHLPHD
jgi:hypothetical protein